MRFRINVIHDSLGKRSIASILVKGGCIYITAPYLPLRFSEYYVASRCLIPPIDQLPADVSLAQGDHWYLRRPPKLSIKPSGQYHIRATGPDSALWGLRSSKLIPLTKHNDAHIFTIGIHEPKYFQNCGAKKRGTHDLNLNIGDPSVEWRAFRIVGYIRNPEKVTGLKKRSLAGEEDMNASELIPADAGVSAPSPVYKMLSGGTEGGVWIGVNPGQEWPRPFILELAFRQWSEFKSKDRAGVVIMSGFDSEAPNDKEMELLAITGPVMVSRFRIIYQRLKLFVKRLALLLHEHFSDH